MVAGLTERPAKYSGKAGENAEFWFHQLDRYFNANGVTDEDIKGDNLLGFLLLLCNRALSFTLIY